MAATPETEPDTWLSNFSVTWIGMPSAARFVANARRRSCNVPGATASTVLEDEGINLRLILGNAYGAVAPASVFSDTFYADVALQPGARMRLPDDHEDRGLHILA
jgi:redox-sensitive bicupin YhaK (pirin superfamily)